MKNDYNYNADVLIRIQTPSREEHSYLFQLKNKEFGMPEQLKLKDLLSKDKDPIIFGI